MKIVISGIAGLSLIFSVTTIFALDDPEQPFTVESTKGARVNLYYYERSAGSVEREKPILLVHGFNSKGKIWLGEKNNYASELTKNGYDVIVVDMRGNAVDTDGDNKIDKPVVGDSWGYGVTDLGDDVGTALGYGIDYLNKNLSGRNYKKADVVTHSTGALAVTSYSRSQGLVPYRNNIDAVIELAPPNNGSTSLIANIKQAAQIIPSLFAQSMIAYEYALEFIDTKVWIPGGRIESEKLRKELMPESLFLKSIEGLGPDTQIKTFIAIGDEDWVVGDWSPVITQREDIGYEYFIGVDHFNFCESEVVIHALIDKLEKGADSNFFKRFKPYKNKNLLAFLSGPGIDHPDDTYDVVTFAKNIEISPRMLFEMYIRLAGKKGKAHLLNYWDALCYFEKAQKELDELEPGNNFFDNWEKILNEKNNALHENYIYASKEYLECPDVAILANGYFNELARLVIERVGEPVRIIDHAFSPSILAEQKVLLIPSGGLSGLSNSAIFKKKLSEFVKNGGTLVCFSQQYGYDFNALPISGLKGYGWQEDSSCHSRAAYIENFHQVLSSQAELYPDFKIDGYFTEYPEDAKVLLRRTKNLMPALLMYNFGKGVVITSTLYSDWGYVNGQTSLSEINFIRDLIRWAKTSRELAGYKIGTDFKKVIELDKDFSKIEMILISPDGTALERKISSEAIYELGAALNKPGIYFVDYILYDAEEQAIQPQTEGFYFCFCQPPEGSSPDPGFKFDITSNTENYINGNEAIFTFHFNNNTAQDETIKFKASLSHHAIEFKESAVVPAKSHTQLDKKIIVKKTDRVVADFYSSGNNFLGRFERGFNVFEPRLDLDLKTDRMQYAPGQVVSIDCSVKNSSAVAIDPLLLVNIVDSKNNQVYYETMAIELKEGKDFYWHHVFKIPEEAKRGSYKIKFDCFSNSSLLGSKSLVIDVPGALIFDSDDAPVTFSELLKIEMAKFIFKPNEPIFAKIIINNKGQKIDSGVLDIRVLPTVETGCLMGKVIDESGNSIKGAFVNGVYTNNSGKYKLENIKKGKHIIDIMAKGYNKISKEIDLLGGDNDLDITLTKAKYGNFVVQLPGCAGSLLLLEPVNVIASDACVRRGVISIENKFEFKNVPVGEYRLSIQPEGITEVVIIEEGSNYIEPYFAAGLGNSIGQQGAIMGSSVSYENEPNNDFPAANYISPGIKTRARIYSYGDEDYFKFQVDSPSILNISLKEVAQGFRPHIKVYNSAEKQIDSTAAFSGEDIDYSLEAGEAGTYYLMVRDRYNTFSSEEEYVLGLDITSGVDAYEPNSNFITAPKINIRERIEGTIFPKGDEDNFLIELEKRGTLFIEMNNAPPGLRPSLKIFDSSGKVVSQKAGSSGEKVFFDTEIEKPGRYYLLIRDWYSNFSSIQPYSFKAYFIDTLDEHEPNDTLDEPVLIDFGMSYFAAISTKGDLDFFKLSIPDSGTVVISLDNVPSNIRPYIKLYQEPRKSWIDSIAGLAGENLTMEFYAANPSNYFVEIQDRYNSESSLAQYNLSALYIPDAEYLLSDNSIFKKEIEIFDVNLTKEVNIEIPGIPDVGKYYLQVALKSLTPAKNSQAVERFYVSDLDVPLEPVPSPDIEVMFLEDANAEYSAGKTASFRFKARNKGDAGGMCNLSFKIKDIFSQSASEFLDAGAEKEFLFNVPLPVELEEGMYEAGYEFGDEKSSFSFKIHGIKLEVSAEYENNLFKIKIKNVGGVKNVPLFAEARCGPYEETKDFILETIEGLNFNIPYPDGEDKIYYGIYFDSGKALYLNSFSLNQAPEAPKDSIKIIEASCDKDKYTQGEKVAMKWKIQSNGGSSVDLKVDLSGPDSSVSELINEQVYLEKGLNLIERDIEPDLSASGVYRISYRFLSEDALLGQGSLFFDVGQEISLNLRLAKREYVEGEDVEVSVSLFSSSLSNGELNLLLDGKSIEKTNIEAEGHKKFDFTIKNTNVGLHSVRSILSNSSIVVEAESEIFKVTKKPKPNHAPILIKIGTKEIMAGETLEFVVEAIDADGDSLIYSAYGLPEGSVFDSIERRFSWRPGYNQIGEYYVTFKVTDGKGSSSEAIKIIVKKGEPLIPVAVPLAEPLSGMAPLEVNFKSSSMDKDGSIVKYEWDFDGKAVYDFSSPESGDVIFAYTGEGIFPAALRVTDNDGNVSVQKVEINVTRNPLAPNVFLEVSPLKGIAPCKIYFKGSSISSSQICKYEWDFNGDGVFDACSFKSPEVVKSYDTPGIYNAEFKVTNSEGLSESENITIEILDPKLLEALALISKDKGDVPIEIKFDGKIDSINSIQKYQWDFEGDGIFDYISLDSPFVEHTYHLPGLYEPILKVTDSKNISVQAKAEVCFGMSVIGNGNFKIKTDSKKGRAPFTVEFSFDSYLEDEDIEYFWDFDGDGFWDIVSKEPRIEFTYLDAGVYVAKAIAKNEYGDTERAKEVIYVTKGKRGNNGTGLLNYSGLSGRTKVLKDRLHRFELSDGTGLVLPAGILFSDDFVNIQKLEENDISREIITDGENIIPVGEYREYTFENQNNPLPKEMTVSIPYLDVDENGFIDGKDIDELTLDAYWLDEEGVEWKIVSDILIFPKENIVTIKINHFTIFGLTGVEIKSNAPSQEPEIPGSDTSSDGGGGGGSGCFIASAVFGSHLAPEVKTLREFRDKYLLESQIGRDVVKLYYRYSPPVAEFIRNKPLLKFLIRRQLKFLVKLVTRVL